MKQYKIAAWFNVLNILLFVDVFLRVTGYIMFVIAYPLRDMLYWMRTKPVLKRIAVPLWIYLTDREDLYGNKEECWRNIGIEPTNWWRKFIVAYYWNPLRNPNWNAYQLIRMPSGERTDEHVVYSNEVYYSFDDAGIFISHSQKDPYTMCRAKFFYVNSDGSHSPSTNEGYYIDHHASIFGDSLVYFKQIGKWWVARSYCKLLLPDSTMNRVLYFILGKRKIREFNIGVFSRVLIRNKFQTYKDENDTCIDNNINNE